jgi:glycerol-3-phosphate cytidylyltransferase
MAIFIEDLAKFRLDNNNKIGCTFSCWDLLHAGHNIFLKDCKERCDILCVGLQTDPTIDRPEKNKPIQSLEERTIQIKSCRYVDYYFIYSSEKTLYDSLVSLKPDIRFLGNDYTNKKYTGDDLNISIYYHPRSDHNYSTTNLRKTIYDRELEKIYKMSNGEL